VAGRKPQWAFRKSDAGSSMTNDVPRNSRTAQQKIRVAYIDHVAQLSGGEIALARLIDALHDVDPVVILAQDGPLVATLMASEVSVEVLPMRERTRNLRKDRVGSRGPLQIAALVDTTTYMFRLARRLRALRPDVVHTNSLKAGVYGSLAARLAGVPVVWHLRDRIAADYLKRPAVLVLRALIAILPNSVVVNSEATRATLWLRRTDAVVVYSPVSAPDDRQRARRRRKRHEPFVIGMVGRIARWKGQHLLLEAFARAFRGGSEVVVVVGAPMFGAAEAGYAEELREMTRTSGIAERVDFRGFRDDIWAELARMDIFVHASVTPEPFGQVIVEAMLAGVPVIASAGGGPSEIVTDGVDGLLYPAGDIDALVELLQRLRGDPRLRSQLSDNARTRAERFSPEAAASSVMSLYGRLLASSQPARRT
jgi:glycosyltransferase involved in cell wall biosynthesis